MRRCGRNPIQTEKKITSTWDLYTSFLLRYPLEYDKTNLQVVVGATPCYYYLVLLPGERPTTKEQTNGQMNKERLDYQVEEEEEERERERDL